MNKSFLEIFMNAAKLHGSRILTGLAALLVMASAETSLGAVRFDVVGSPTEVVNTGRSEVLGSLNLIVRGTGNVTGTSVGGSSQLGISFTNPALQIDNTTASGIKIFWSTGFNAANPSIVSVENRDIGGGCAGFITLNIEAGAALSEGDFIKIEGIRGRIDSSSAVVPGTDLFLDIQSINDPAANTFSPDRIRVAKSLKGLNAEIVASSTLYEIRLAEGFLRSFVDSDAANDGVNVNDRTDSGGGALGAPTNSTQISIQMEDIDENILGVVWPVTSTFPGNGAQLRLVSSQFSGTSASATYSFESPNQVGSSDVLLESFILNPGFQLSGVKCNIPIPNTFVTLAPAVAASSGCASPTGTQSRPRFLTVFELSVQKLSPSSVVMGGNGIVLTVHGTGFVEGSTVQWNGSARPTTFVSTTQLSAAIAAADLIKEGTAEVRVVNPQDSGGGVSGTLTFTIEPHALTLYFPRLVSIDGDPDSPGDSEFTGVALANTSGRTAVLNLTALDGSGEVIAGAGITNPATLTLGAGEQLPLLAYQIFGSGLSEAESLGWIKVEGNVAQVVGFFLSFNGTLEYLDGADVSSRTLTSFVLPEILGNGFTQIHIANPQDEPASVTLELVKADGNLRAQPAQRPLAPNGVLMDTVSGLFPNALAQDSDYVRVTASHGVVPLEYLGRTGADVVVLNGQDAGGGAAALYSPQYVVGGPDWESTLSIINLSPTSGTVSLAFVSDDGTPVGPTQVLPMPARGKIMLDDQTLFTGAAAPMTQGYLVISGDGIELTGNVVFGHTSGDSFAAALPLVSELQSSMLFSQVASSDLFFTGLAILNPDDVAANAIIQVFDSGGGILASKIEPIPARGRKSMLLTEYFPQLTGQGIQAGYVRVTSIRNLGAFALFGTTDLTVLSAIPPQVVP